MSLEHIPGARTVATATVSPVVDRLIQLEAGFGQGRRREDRSLRRLGVGGAPGPAGARPHLSGGVTDLPSLVGVAARMFV